jgi:hypothetical protein
MEAGPAVLKEALAGTPYDDKADMFSLGCLLYELCVLKSVVSSRPEAHS